jgi:ketosteroid isomerase-like protein
MAKATGTMEERLRRLEDERAILRTLYLYSHGIDYDLEAEWLDCFTDDARLYWPGQEPYEGHRAIAEVFRAHPHAPASWMKHFVALPLIEVEGDSARVNSYYQRLVGEPWTAEGGPKVASFGRYEDVLVRGDDGKWRFKERRAHNEAGLEGGVKAPYRDLDV